MHARTFAVAAVALLALGPLALAAPDHPAVPYDLAFAGDFRLAFGAGPGFEDELTFAGRGGGEPVGSARVEGRSLATMGLDGCSTIVEDAVTIATGRGTLLLENEGSDCVDPLSAPGRLLIRGSGTTTILGGTGAFEGATGRGTWTVLAEVESIEPGAARGSFGPLRFEGALHLPA